MRNLIINLLLYYLTSVSLFAQQNVSDIPNPLDVAKLIGDKLIRDTQFKYKLTVGKNNHQFNGLHFIDFGRTFGLNKRAVAYAYTQLTVSKDTILVIQIAHNDDCKVWMNGNLVYQKRGTRSLNLRFEERSIEISDQFSLHLKKGENNILIKSGTYGKEWVVFLQPPGLKGAIVNNSVEYPTIGLKAVSDVDAKIADLSNWLVIGPFADANENLFDIEYAPEKEILLGKMYEGAEYPVTWTIPKIEVLGEMMNPQPWGTNDTWNYHNGGVAWAMQHLAEITGEKKYDQYATDFCNFHLKGAPFVNYQVKTLHAVNSANSNFLFAPLLDFTLAPSLPFVYRLLKNNTFDERDSYIHFIDRMLNYAKNEQVRLPGSNIFTRLTPEKYTTWVDDMFMGIPFLVQASQYVCSPEEKKRFLDDAANQTVKFNEQVWDKEANLYMHAKYSEKAIKLPHWSRANGWGIWATTEVLLVLPKTHPTYKMIMQHYRKHVDALIALQDNNGFWRQLLDRPDSPQEVSGTAIFTIAIARGISNGWLDARKYKPFAMKGWEAIKTQVEPDGTVHKICYGTMCSEDVNYYLQRPFYDNDTHGLFAVLFAAIEMHKLISKK